MLAQLIDEGPCYFVACCSLLMKAGMLPLMALKAKVKAFCCCERVRPLPLTHNTVHMYYIYEVSRHASAVELYCRGIYAFALPLCIVNTNTPTPDSEKISLGCMAQASHIDAECYEFGLGVAEVALQTWRLQPARHEGGTAVVRA
jgi:hypothetical protein